MSRSLRPALPLLVAALSAACAGRGTARPSGTAENSPEPAASPLARSRFSLMNAKLNMPPLPESGTASEGQVAVPLNTSDPRYAEYFAELKRRMAQPFPPIPGSIDGEVIPISINFTYPLHGYRLYRLR